MFVGLCIIGFARTHSNIKEVDAFAILTSFIQCDEIVRCESDMLLFLHSI
jgi:hypothetical protein